MTYSLYVSPYCIRYVYLHKGKPCSMFSLDVSKGHWEQRAPTKGSGALAAAGLPRGQQRSESQVQGTKWSVSKASDPGNYFFMLLDEGHRSRLTFGAIKGFHNFKAIP